MKRIMAIWGFVMAPNSNDLGFLLSEIVLLVLYDLSTKITIES